MVDAESNMGNKIGATMQRTPSPKVSQIQEFSFAAKRNVSAFWVSWGLYWSYGSCFLRTYVLVIVLVIGNHTGA